MIDLVDAVVRIVREAGEVVLRHYASVDPSSLDVQRKADDSPVTAADREANALLVARLGALVPGVPVVAEESDLPAWEARAGWRRFWLVDPLDGTKEFLARNGEFTVNVALVEDGEPVVGVLLAPARRVLYFASKGGGAWKVDLAAAVGAERAAARRILSRRPVEDGRGLEVLTSRSHASANEAASLLGGRKIAREIHLGSALKFGLLAEGAADVYLRRGRTMEWDTAAGDCLWRNSVPPGAPLRSSPLRYGKPVVENPGFVIGLVP